MPTTRRRCVRGRKGITLKDVGIEEFMDWQVGWTLPAPGTEYDPRRCRWRSWAEFDADYASLRDQRDNPLWFGTPTFAEERWQAIQRGEEPPIRRGENVAND